MKSTFDFKSAQDLSLNKMPASVCQQEGEDPLRKVHPESVWPVKMATGVPGRSAVGARKSGARTPIHLMVELWSVAVPVRVLPAYLAVKWSRFPMNRCEKVRVSSEIETSSKGSAPPKIHTS